MRRQGCGEAVPVQIGGTRSASYHGSRDVSAATVAKRDGAGCTVQDRDRTADGPLQRRLRDTGSVSATRYAALHGSSGRPRHILLNTFRDVAA
jgi:hypothetical protein